MTSKLKTIFWFGWLVVSLSLMALSSILYNRLGCIEVWCPNPYLKLFFVGAVMFAFWPPLFDILFGDVKRYEEERFE